MRILLVGEAAEHEADLHVHLDASHDVVALPVEAATTAAHDDAIGPDDVVVSLRFRRDGQAPPFRLLHVPGAGLDGVDLDALHPATAVCNVFEHEIPIAEFVLARLLEWHIRAAANPLRPGDWAGQYRRRVPHGELHGSTVGIVGFGRIGRAVAARAEAFGVRVVAVDPLATDRAVRLPAELPRVAAECDALVVTCPLTPETTGLVDAAVLAALPAHAVVVNVSRAAVVDQDALYEALRHNVIGGAILDVWYRYPAPGDDTPPPADHPFWALPNVWCTPHTSAWTRPLSARRYAVVAENVNRLVAGRPLINPVRDGAERAGSRRSAG